MNNVVKGVVDRDSAPVELVLYWGTVMIDMYRRWGEGLFGKVIFELRSE